MYIPEFESAYWIDIKHYLKLHPDHTVIYFKATLANIITKTTFSKEDIKILNAELSNYVKEKMDEDCVNYAQLKSEKAKIIKNITTYTKSSEQEIKAVMNCILKDLKEKKNPFLDRAVLRGSDFIFSQKVLDINQVSGSLQMELNYLMNTYGYQLNASGTGLK